MSMKNFNDTIGNRTGDLPACSAGPQPTALPGAPNLKICKKETNAQYCIDTLENWWECLPLFKVEERKVYNSYDPSR